MEKKYCFELEMKVRDYECDMQGIVNNANYQHYLEHARHEFLQSTGTAFVDMREQGIEPGVCRIEIDYKTSLKSQDWFIVSYFYGKKVLNLSFIRIFFADQTANSVSKVEWKLSVS